MRLAETASGKDRFPSGEDRTLTVAGGDFT